MGIEQQQSGASEKGTSRPQLDALRAELKAGQGRQKAPGAVSEGQEVQKAPRAIEDIISSFDSVLQNRTGRIEQRVPASSDGGDMVYNVLYTVSYRRGGGGYDAEHHLLQFRVPNNGASNDASVAIAKKQSDNRYHFVGEPKNIRFSLGANKKACDQVVAQLKGRVW